MLKYMREFYCEDIKIKRNIICKICNKAHEYGTQLLYCPIKHEYCSKCINNTNISCFICIYLLEN